MNLISELFFIKSAAQTFTVRPNIYMVRNKHVISCYLKSDQKNLYRNKCNSIRGQLYMYIKSILTNDDRSTA